MNKPDRSVAERVYRILLLVYPREFRRAYGAEVTQMFGRLHRERRADGGLRQLFALWRRSLSQLITGGLRERWERRRDRRARPPRGPLRSRYRFWSDVRLAGRSFRRYPGYAILTVVIAALGIGATTTIFSIVDHIVIRLLPYPRSSALVTVRTGIGSLSVPDFVDLRDRVDSFDAVAAAWDLTSDVTDAGDPVRVSAVQVTPAFLPMLGATAAAGRLFDAGDFAPRAPHVVVMSHGLWQRRWGGDSTIVGRTISVYGRPAEVIGVLDRGFHPPEAILPSDVALWSPLDLTRSGFQNRQLLLLSVIARRTPGSTLAGAQAELDVLAQSLADAYPDSHRTRNGDPVPWIMQTLRAATVGDITQPLYLLLGAVGLLLVIGCANVANLVLARTADRRRELAVRAALGAGRACLVGHVVTESLVFGIVGGAVGVGLAFFGVDAFLLLEPGTIPRVSEVAVDWRVLGFASGLSVLTGLLFALVPAMEHVRGGVPHGLQALGHHATTGRRRTRIRSALIVTEIALATMLLLGAGLLFQSFMRLRAVDPGFDPDDTVVMSVTAPTAVHEPDGEGARFARTILQRIRSLPGVVSVGGAVRVPFGSRCCVTARAALAGEAGDTVMTWVHFVTPGFLEALGARVRRGRTLTGNDERTATDGPIPGLLNASLARQLVGDGDALARLVDLGGFQVRVVGLVDDIRHFELDEPGTPALYVPYFYMARNQRRLEIVVRTETDLASIAPAMRRIVWDLDSDLPVEPPITMADRIAGSITTPRFYSWLFGFFGGLALLLAATGIYATVSYGIRQRRRELSIRLALGAQDGDVLRMIVVSGVRLAGLGLGLGLAGALALRRLLDGLVFGITTSDPETYLTVSFLLALLAVTATYVPARAVTRADPVETLRAE
jgi:putative ABC transport system permease protein